jgi:shikimate dehydrogenase
MKKKAYVVGKNASQSLSPHIFNYWFKQNNINGEYFYKQVDLKNFNKEIDKILLEKEVCGFNVTIPFKELIKNKLSKIDIHSKNIGAINCVSRINNKWSGKNTDWVGFSKAINYRNKILSKKSAIVIGYGGAAKAVIYALKKEGFNQIKVFNRTKEKIQHLKKDKDVVPLDLHLLPKHLKDTDLIVNATPIDILKSLLVPKTINNSFACDIVYRPKETGFLSHFLKNKRIYGISMLVYQAAPCFEEWFGVKPTIDHKLLNYLDKYIS